MYFKNFFINSCGLYIGCICNWIPLHNGKCILLQDPNGAYIDIVCKQVIPLVNSNLGALSCSKTIALKFSFVNSIPFGLPVLPPDLTITAVLFSSYGASVFPEYFLPFFTKSFHRINSFNPEVWFLYSSFIFLDISLIILLDALFIFSYRGIESDNDVEITQSILKSSLDSLIAFEISEHLASKITALVEFVSFIYFIISFLFAVGKTIFIVAPTSFNA